MRVEQNNSKKIYFYEFCVHSWEDKTYNVSVQNSNVPYDSDKTYKYIIITALVFIKNSIRIDPLKQKLPDLKAYIHVFNTMNRKVAFF